MIEIDLTGQVVAITGSSKGIGVGIAERFAAAGASLVLQYRSGPAPTSTAPAVAVQLDLVDDGAPGALVDAAIGEFGRLDAVVNNAAVQTHAELIDMSEQEWSTMIDTNLTAVQRVSQRFAQHAVERGGGGSIVHIASIEGSQPAAGHGHYGISKAAMLMHTKVGAIEFGAYGIRVNAVSPGLVDRPGLADDWPEGVGRWMDKVPLGRMGSPTDIGDACVFLCSPMASWISGTNLIVDGGISARATW